MSVHAGFSIPLASEVKGHMLKISPTNVVRLALDTRPRAAIKRSKFDSFEDMYAEGPQAGGRDQTLQRLATITTSSLPHKRTVSSVSDVAGNPGNTKLAKPTTESESPSLNTNTDADTSTTTPTSVSNAEDADTSVTKAAVEGAENKESKDELDYLFDEEGDKTTTSLALAV